jgi:hypothetical protein
MADDDDDKKGSRDNTGREHKPENAQNKENAPSGQLGTNRLIVQGLSLGGGSKPRQATQKIDQTPPPPGQGKNAEPAKDNRPVFHETNDPDVNRHYKQDHRMIPKDSPQHPDNPNKGAEAQKPEGPRISQSDFAKAFRQANQKTQSMQQSRGLDHD